MTYEKITEEQLVNRFSYHRATEEQGRTYDFIRKRCLELARDLVRSAPDGPELRRALHALDDCMFLTNAAIARHRT